jgi:hypothetical protein
MSYIRISLMCQSREGMGDLAVEAGDLGLQPGPGGMPRLLRHQRHVPLRSQLHLAIRAGHTERSSIIH